MCIEINPCFHVKSIMQDNIHAKLCIILNKAVECLKIVCNSVDDGKSDVI